jgi:hypothetical protein
MEKAESAPSLADVLAAVKGLGVELKALKETQVAQAEYMDTVVERVDQIAEQQAALPAMAPGLPGQTPDLANMLQEIEDLKARPAGQETAEQAKERYARELKRESQKLREGQHRQFIHYAPEWCAAQDPPLPLVRNVIGKEQAAAAEADGYYPTLRKAGEIAALSAALKPAQDAAEVALKRANPRASEAEIAEARLSAKAAPPSSAEIQKHMMIIHKAVGKVGHEGWQKLPAA